MAERRMISKTIVESDIFLDLDLSAQALYFHLSLNADNEGFVGSPKRVQRLIGASDNDMKQLLDKRYILSFESGVVVIKHWYINNYIRGDRKGGTTYLEEKSLLKLDNKNAYTEATKSMSKDKQMTDKCQTDGRQMTDKCPPREDKIREDKIRIEENNISAHTHEDNFSSDLDYLIGIPTLQEVKDFVTLHSYPIDPETFYNHYSSVGWKKGGQPIENWEALVVQWARTENMRGGLKNYAKNEIKPQQRNYTREELKDIFGSREISDEEL